VTYNKQLTALLVIDPYNDFISEGGKLWDRLKGVAEANHCVPNMLQVLTAARKAELRVFYALHHRYRPGDGELLGCGDACLSRHQSPKLRQRHCHHD
jgi:ureidoacrylate peracid hydrolase